MSGGGAYVPNGALVEVKALVKEFQGGGALFAGRRRAPAVRAVRGVSLDIEAGEVLGLVGESGSGKTTIGRCIMGLEKPTSGEISFSGEPISRLDHSGLRRLRGRMQMVFQDPRSSLNPRMTVAQTLDEPLRLLTDATREQRLERVATILGEVGLSSDVFQRYPLQLSGGQQQRVSIARALILNPAFMVLDEPVSALDASIRWQVLELLTEIRHRHRLTYLYISHDLDTVRAVCQRVAIMAGGSIVESGPVESIFEHPVHPYTRILLSSVLEANPHRRRRLDRRDSVARILGENRATFEPPPNQPVLVKVGEDHYSASDDGTTLTP